MFNYCNKGIEVSKVGILPFCVGILVWARLNNIFLVTCSWNTKKKGKNCICNTRQSTTKSSSTKELNNSIVLKIKEFNCFMHYCNHPV